MMASCYWTVDTATVLGVKLVKQLSISISVVQWSSLQPQHERERDDIPGRTEGSQGRPEEEDEGETDWSDSGEQGRAVQESY